MKSEYGKQIKAFFHFSLKHLFENEFGIRVAIEILIFLVLLYILSKLCYKIWGKIKVYIILINREIVVPLRVRMFEKLAFSTSNPFWQEKANKIKDTFKGNDESIKIRVNKKSHKGWWIVTYIFLVLWITGFHYYGENKRKNYEVFFLGEKTVLAFEELTRDKWFKTNEKVVECFFHNEIEKK